MSHVSAFKKSTAFALLLTCMAGVSFTTNATTGIHKWVDDNGRTHYTDTPPPQSAKKSTEVAVRQYKSLPKPAPVTLSNTNSSLENIEVDSGKGKSNPDAERNKQLEAELKAQKEAQNKQRCDALRTSQDNLSIGGRIYEMKDGKRKYLSGAEIDAKREKVSNAYARNCR